MGSNRKLLSGVLLVVAALVFWGLYVSLKRSSSMVATAPTPSPATVQVSAPINGAVAYAAEDIPAYSIVTKDMLTMRKLAGNGPTTFFITNPELQAVGYITRVPLSKGTLIRPDGDFIGHISETGIAGALHPGTRAMVIPFANKPTLHDLVRVGNYIDVNSAFDGQEARTIVQGVRVLAVDVFGNDYPQVNVAVRGPYKADAKGNGISSSPAASGAVGANGVPIAPGATPTPTPAPAQAPARPDPALTLEVTPAQANTILLAQASGGVLDFVVRPALPGSRDGDFVLVGEDSTNAVPGATPSPNGLRAVSITKAQIAPYAERKKAVGAASGGTRTVSASSGGSGGGGGYHQVSRIEPPIQIPSANPPVIPVTNFPPPVPQESPTYDIPIYADGKTVRVETVRRPQQ